MQKMVAAAMKAADTPGLNMDAPEHPQALVQKAVECRRARLASATLELTQLKHKRQSLRNEVATLNEDIETFRDYEALLVNCEADEVRCRVVFRSCP
jgi:hypothetical protein